MQVIDKINQGRLGKVYFAARGRDTREWMMKREQLSPRYTTALGELPVTTLIALHDLNQALKCDRLAVLERGRLVALGAPLEVLTPQRLQETFGVRAHYLTDPFDGAQILRFHS